MAAWIVLYCQRSLAAVTPEMILAGLEDVDWWTLAEDHGIEDEAVVQKALKYLQIKALPSDETGKQCYELRYRPRGRRQVAIERWTDAALVAKEIQVSRRELARVRKPGGRLIREHLARVRETVGLELGWDQLEDMAVVLAYQVAWWLARVGKGLIEDHHGVWWGLTRGGFYKELLPSTRASR